MIGSRALGWRAAHGKRGLPGFLRPLSSRNNGAVGTAFQPLAVRQRCLIVQARMGPHFVVVAAPVVNHDFRFDVVAKPLHRNLPLKLSFVPFCHGLPGSISADSIFSDTTHPSSAALTNSGRCRFAYIAVRCER
jgi:hypothetical protein